jgi:membrane protein YdbS with pleckstrin-like domain
MPPDREFRSKIDAWLVAIVAVAALLPLAVGVALALLGQTKGVLLLSGWGAVMGLMIYVLSWPLRYTLRADHLHIQSGQLAWTIPYAAIRGAVPSRNPLSAPAWSLRRVRIDQADGSFILVSPADRESFIADLTSRCPQLASGRTARSGPASPS